MPPTLGFAAKIYVGSVQIILIFTAFAKLFSAFGNVKILAVMDPSLGISNRNLFIIAAVFELLVVACVHFCRNMRTQCLLILWLCYALIVYRISIWCEGVSKPCPCLGNLTDAIHIPSQTADMAMKIILAYMLVGSYATLFWLWRQHGRAEARMWKDQLKPAASSQMEVGS